MSPQRFALRRTIQLWLSLYTTVIFVYAIGRALKTDAMAAAERPKPVVQKVTPVQVSAKIIAQDVAPSAEAMPHPAAQPSVTRMAGKSAASAHSFRQDFSRLARRGRDLEAKSSTRGQVDVEVDSNYVEAARSFGARFVLSARSVSSIGDLNGSLEITSKGTLSPFRAASAPAARYIIRQLGQGDLPFYFGAATERATQLGGPGQKIYALRPRDLFYAEIAAIDSELFSLHGLHLKDCQGALILYAKTGGDWAPELKAYR